LSVNYKAPFAELFQGFCMSGKLVGFAIMPIIKSQFGFEAMAVFIADFTTITLLIGISVTGLAWTSWSKPA
jgi:hypothetical protein